MPYTIGIDFGTESGRALLVDARDGREVATAVHAYANGVIDEHLPGSDKPAAARLGAARPERLHRSASSNAVPAVLQGRAASIRPT